MAQKITNKKKGPSSHTEKCLIKMHLFFLQNFSVGLMAIRSTIKKERSVQIPLKQKLSADTR